MKISAERQTEERLTNRARTLMKRNEPARVAQRPRHRIILTVQSSYSGALCLQARRCVQTSSRSADARPRAHGRSVLRTSHTWIFAVGAYSRYTAKRPALRLYCCGCKESRLEYVTEMCWRIEF